MSSSSSQFVVDQELHIDNVNHLVDRFTIAQQERDMAIQAELTRYLNQLSMQAGLCLFIPV